MTVVAVTGHRHLGDPAAARSAIRAALADEPRPLVGLSTLAAGADQLFADVVLELGGSLEVLIPSAEYSETLDAPARAGFDRLCAAARSVAVLPPVPDREDQYVAAGEAMLDRCDVLLAVWDGQPGRGAGGTADMVARARARGLPVRVVPAGRDAGPD
ncbi:hypothetical protein [Naasia aerilata]|uniref:Uncharacterized protein n=1 Tax=Naasia aerilata TaxID=1162966 RepID=A0ABN6XSE1_9MICO|nr:hypothetical protein [Naasia aerilata]BDZ47088.1 hypothetical protein GCM10025866_29970 [Naasia aerilata]